MPILWVKIQPSRFPGGDKGLWYLSLLSARALPQVGHLEQIVLTEEGPVLLSQYVYGTGQHCAPPDRQRRNNLHMGILSKQTPT